MSTETGIAKADTEEVVAFAKDLGWVPLDKSQSHRWQVTGMRVEVAWHPVDDEYGAFVAEGPDADVLIQDIDEGFDLLGDVEVMTRIGEAETPDELLQWARRLGAFALGEVEPTVLNVLGGLMTAPKQAFAAAAVAGLKRAAWPDLLPILDTVAQRWPDLGGACEQVRTAIRLEQSS